MIAQIPAIQTLPHTAKAVVNFLNASMKGIKNIDQLSLREGFCYMLGNMPLGGDYTFQYFLRCSIDKLFLCLVFYL